MKIILLVVFCFCLIQGTHAQWRYGVKAGYNLNNISVTNNVAGSNFNYIWGFNVGLFVKVPITRLFSLQPELMYSYQGAAFGDTSGEQRYHFINLPVLFKYQHASGFFAETGPQLGFMVSANIIGTNKDANITSKSQPADFSWAFGLGYKLPKKRIGGDLRYNLGLSNIAGNDIQATYKNSVFQLDVFYLF